MDKNKKKNKSKRKKDNKSISNKIAQLRGWIQAAATLLTNIHIPNIFKGKIYHLYVGSSYEESRKIDSLLDQYGQYSISNYEVF